MTPFIPTEASIPWVCTQLAPCLNPLPLAVSWTMLPPSEPLKPALKRHSWGLDVRFLQLPTLPFTAGSLTAFSRFSPCPFGAMSEIEIQNLLIPSLWSDTEQLAANLLTAAWAYTCTRTKWSLVVFLCLPWGTRTEQQCCHCTGQAPQQTGASELPTRGAGRLWGAGHKDTWGWRLWASEEGLGQCTGPGAAL